MAVYLVGAEKGGIGKTTLATNLAAMRAIAKRDVLLIDLDSQGHAGIWNEVRAEDAGLAMLTCVSLRGRGIDAEIRKLATRYEDLVIDAGGRDTLELRQAMLACDIMVVPTRASQVDLQGLALIDRLVSDVLAFNTRLQAMVVINAAPTNAKSSDVDDARTIVHEMRHLALAESVICDRVSFRRAYRDGLAAVEYQPADERARHEMRALYAEVFGWQTRTQAQAPLLRQVALPLPTRKASA
jgi:chromosome partitioning protein